MNRQDIERLAREAKGHPYTNRYTPGETAFAFSIERLEHFVSLVAAAERNDCIAIIENERHFWSHQDAIDVCNLAIDSIRARSNK